MLIWDAVNKRPINYITRPGDGPHEPTADGKGILYSTESGGTSTIYRYDIATRQGTALFSMPSGHLTSDLAVSKDGTKIAAMGLYSPKVLIYDAVTQSVTANFDTVARPGYQIEFVDADRKIAVSGLRTYRLDGTPANVQDHEYFRNRFTTDNAGKYIFTKTAGSPKVLRCFRAYDLKLLWSHNSLLDDVPLPIGGMDGLLTRNHDGDYRQDLIQASTGAFIAHLPIYVDVTTAVSPTSPVIYWNGNVSLKALTVGPTGAVAEDTVFDRSATWWGGWNTHLIGGRPYVEEAGPGARLLYDAITGQRYIGAARSTYGYLSPGAEFMAASGDWNSLILTKLRFHESGQPYDEILSEVTSPSPNATPQWDGPNYIYRQSGPDFHIYGRSGNSLAFLRTATVDPHDYGVLFGGGKFVGYREEQYAGYGSRLVVKRVIDDVEIARIEKLSEGKGLAWSPLDGDRFATQEWADVYGGANLIVKVYDLSSGAAVQVGGFTYFQPAERGTYGYADVSRDGTIAVVFSGYGPVNEDKTWASRIAYVRVADGRVLRTYDDQFVATPAYGKMLPNNIGFAWHCSNTSLSSVAAFAVTDAPAVIRSLAVTSARIPSGGSTTATVTINRPARPGGITIGISTTSDGPVTAPTSVTIPEGEIAATFTVATRPSATTRATLLASYDRLVLRQSLTVLP